MSASNGMVGTAYQWIIGVLISILIVITSGASIMLMNEISDIKSDIRGLQVSLADAKIMEHDVIQLRISEGKLEEIIDKLKGDVNDRIKTDEFGIRSLEDRMSDIEKRRK